MNKSWVFSHQMKLTAIFFTSIFLAVASADILQNPDFEISPSNSKENPNSPLFSLDANSTIPGYAFEGAVEYATVGEDLSLPRKGHAILFVQDGKINQTFTAKDDTVQFLMTFTLAIVGQNCKSNASLVVSAPDSSAQFSFSGKYGKELWEVYDHQIGSWEDGNSINLVLQSQAIDADTNYTCWPVVDNLSLSTIGTLNQDKDLAQNRYFEDEAFIGYLKYLQYWQRPEYIKFIMYPHCLFFLELLQNPNFRNAMAHPANKELAHRQQFHFWKNHRNNRLKHILPKPLPEPTSAPSAVPPPTLPPATMITAAPAPPVPSSAANQVPSSMQYGGIGSGSVFVKNDPRNSGIDRRKRKKDG